MQNQPTKGPLASEGETKTEAMPPLSFNLLKLETLRRHFHRIGNEMDRALLTCPEQKKLIYRQQRDFFKSVANYLDVADHIKMAEL